MADTRTYYDGERYHVTHDLCGQWHASASTVTGLVAQIVGRKVAGDWPANVAQHLLGAVELASGVGGHGWEVRA